MLVKTNLRSLINLKFDSSPKQCEKTNLHNFSSLSFSSRRVPEDMAINPFSPAKQSNDLLSENLKELETHKSNFFSGEILDVKFEKSKTFKFEKPNACLFSEDEETFNEFEENGLQYRKVLNQENNFYNHFSSIFGSSENLSEESTILKKRNSLDVNFFKEKEASKTLFSHKTAVNLNTSLDCSTFKKVKEKNTNIQTDTSEKISTNPIKSFREDSIESFSQEEIHNTSFSLNDKEKNKIKKISHYWGSKTKLIPSVFRNLRKIENTKNFLFEKQDLSHKELLGKLNYYFLNNQCNHSNLLLKIPKSLEKTTN